MIDRLRFLLDHPLDPPAARAVVVLATAVLLGFTAIVVLGAGESDSPTAPREQPKPTHVSPHQMGIAPVEGAPPAPRQAAHRRQDPQDEKESPAARRAARTLRSHRALQHVPYRSGELKVVLVGTRGDRAELRVSAPTTRAARQGWRRFLRHYRDSGRAYVPLFESASGGSDG